MQIEVVVEIPKGTRNKYEADEKGTIWLDRMLFTSTRYPEDYGFVPETLAEDGDPVDAAEYVVGEEVAAASDHHDKGRQAGDGHQHDALAPPPPAGRVRIGTGERWAVGIVLRSIGQFCPLCRPGAR